MAVSKLSNLIVKGVLNNFHEGMESVPSIYPNHCQTINSTTATEQLVWPGQLPRPREYVNGRQIQEIRDFTYSVANSEYELTFLLGRKHLEDDQTGLMMARARECGEAWQEYKEYLFATMVVAGGTSTATYDGNKFYADSGDARTIGDSATIDNVTTSAAATSTIPTVDELLDTVSTVKATMMRFQSDQGQPYNSGAIRNLRLIVPPTYEKPCMQAKHATTIPVQGTSTSATSSTVTNVFTSLFDFDVSPHLSSDAIMYVNAVGGVRKPFVYQERTALEIHMSSSTEEMIRNNGLLVQCRQRFVFAYGEPRRSVQHTFS